MSDIDVVILTVAITLSVAILVGLFAFAWASGDREKSFQHEVAVYDYRLRDLESECWRQRRLADHYRERCRKLRGELRQLRLVRDDELRRARVEQPPSDLFHVVATDNANALSDDSGDHIPDLAAAAMDFEIERAIATYGDAVRNHHTGIALGHAKAGILDIVRRLRQRADELQHLRAAGAWNDRPIQGPPS